VGWPVAMEVVEEGRPVWLQTVHLEIAQRKREAVVDADERWWTVGQLLHQPFGYGSPGPISPCGGVGLLRPRGVLGQIDAQPRQHCGRRLGARIVDTDISLENGHGEA